MLKKTGVYSKIYKDRIYRPIIMSLCNINGGYDDMRAY